MSYCSACGGWKGTVHTCSGNMQVDTSSNSSQKNQTKSDKYMIDPKFKTKLDGVNKVKETIIKTTPSGSDNSNRSGSR
ncbi:unnamed protein product [Rhizophagus irregularis]|nr:unnamed protein product [Rhizophagus irregularis]